LIITTIHNPGGSLSGLPFGTVSWIEANTREWLDAAKVALADPTLPESARPDMATVDRIMLRVSEPPAGTTISLFQIRADCEWRVNEMLRLIDATLAAAA
jgi:hypothetical protein